MRQEMRRNDRQISQEEALELLEKNTVGILTTVCEDGYPYGLPISYAYEDGKIYIHKAIEGGLLSKNIANGEKACFTVVGDTETLPAKFSTKYESVIAFGTIRECTDKVPALMRLVKKYSPDFMEKGLKYAEGSQSKVTIYEFQIEQLTGKARR